MFCSAEPANAPDASYLRTIFCASLAPVSNAAFLMPSTVAADSGPLAAAATSCFSAKLCAAFSAAAIAGRLNAAAAPPVRMLGMIDGIASPIASLTYVSALPTVLISLYDATSAGYSFSVSFWYAAASSNCFLA